MFSPGEGLCQGSSTFILTLFELSCVYEEREGEREPYMYIYIYIYDSNVKRSLIFKWSQSKYKASFLNKKAAFKLETLQRKQ